MSEPLKIGSKVLYKGKPATIYAINNQIGYLGKKAYNICIDNLPKEDIKQIE